jgi:hypothetical protein
MRPLSGHLLTSGSGAMMLRSKLSKNQKPDSLDVCAGKLGFELEFDQADPDPRDRGARMDGTIGLATQHGVTSRAAQRVAKFPLITRKKNAVMARRDKGRTHLTMEQEPGRAR